MKRISNNYHQEVVLRNFDKKFLTVRFLTEQLLNALFSFVWFVFLESFRDTFTKCNATVSMSRNNWECESARSDIKLTTLLV